MFSQVFLFFEFTAPEIMLILFVVLLLFGGDKLPGLARGLGKGIREFKDASDGIKREISSQIDTVSQAHGTPVETPALIQYCDSVPDVKIPTLIEYCDNVPDSETGPIAKVEPVKEPIFVANAVHLTETPI
jgi:sec-independent protein translocase protein TatA